MEIPNEEDIDFDDDIPVYLSIFINYESDNTPYKITAKILSLFKVSNLMSHEDALQVLQTDAASILLSYLRPIVSMMTAASGFDALTLPMLDFSDSDDDNN